MLFKLAQVTRSITLFPMESICMRRSQLVRLLWGLAKAMLLAVALMLLAAYFSRYVREAGGTEIRVAATQFR